MAEKKPPVPPRTLNEIAKPRTRPEEEDDALRTTKDRAALPVNQGIPNDPEPGKGYEEEEEQE